MHDGHEFWQVDEVFSCQKPIHYEKVNCSTVYKWAIRSVTTTLPTLELRRFVWCLKNDCWTCSSLQKNGLTHLVISFHLVPGCVKQAVSWYSLLLSGTFFQWFSGLLVNCSRAQAYQYFVVLLVRTCASKQEKVRKSKAGQARSHFLKSYWSQMIKKFKKCQKVPKSLTGQTTYIRQSNYRHRSQIRGV